MSPPTAEQKEYLNTLEDLTDMIQRAQVNIKKCPKQRLTVGYIKTRLQTIETYWNSFREAHTNLTKCTPKEQRATIQYFLNEDYYTVEDFYLCLHADLVDTLSNLESSDRNKKGPDGPPPPQDNLSFTKLPRIQLPTFSGRYEDWPTYQDLFTALVHNTKLTNVQKLHYLKTSVSGEAEILLRHIQITEDNYTHAWELLQGRFGNKKMIVNSLLRRLFGQRKAANQSANQIKALLDTTTECINSLNNLSITTDSWDPVIVFLVGQKLDTELLKDWEEYALKENGDNLPTWEEMKKFLESKFRTLELVAPIPTSSRDKPQTHKSFHATADNKEEEEDDNDIFQSAHANVSTQPSCTFCKDNHYLFHCKEFAKLTVEQRQEFAKNNRLCFNCLVPNHTVLKCKQSTSCRICRRRHHSLLHQVKEIEQEKEAQPQVQSHTQPQDKSQPQDQPQTQPEQKITTAHCSREQTSHDVLLATAQVEVKARNGDTHILRALVDQGSEASFVSARVVDLLELKKLNINGVVSGVGEGSQIPLKHLVELSIISRHTSQALQVKTYVLKSISTKLPSKHITINQHPQFQNLQLADPTYDTPGKIDLLLGADVFCKIIEDGVVKMADGIVAQKTSLGWILSGQKIDSKTSKSHNVVTLHVTRMVAEDNNLLRSFWEIESILYKKKKILTKEEEKCEEIYKDTTTRDKSGRYTVHLPLKQDIEETIKLCGKTKQQAINRFIHLEKKFEKSDKLKTEYSKVIQEYKEMNHLKKTDTKDDSMAIYLPHHAVIREDKDTTKVRVVYDASAKGSHGRSLNDAMLVGPVLQPDLRSLITTWRTHKICVVGDIMKMYRMINMTDAHTNLQRIIWRDNQNDEFESYKLTTVTFGTAAAPYLAVRTLAQLAEDESSEYPEAAKIIKGSFYMDDLMAGHDTIDKTKQMCKDVRTVLEKGGFKMQKWSSNSEEVLEFLKREDTTKDIIEIKLDKIIKILGLSWDRKNDEFEITVNLPEPKQPITKRSILSDVARLFDPFGWLSPVVICAKVLIQKLWLCSTGWDDELPLNIKEEWMTYRESLIHLQNIRVPRWFKTTPDNRHVVQIHGFADASTQAFAAVTYLRVFESGTGTVHVTMIASRSKVAPLKQLSVPKLELCAAALLAELMGDLKELLDIPMDNIYAWTDSTVVLSWLQSHPSRWRTFVANRVADITRIIDNDKWRHVQSTDNPADIATRGIQACDLAAKEIWWTGPQWLREQQIEYDRHDIPQTDLEMKRAFHTTIQEEAIWERFSTIIRMKRVLSYCKRWMKKDFSEETQKYLTTNEMEEILETCIKYYQNLAYGREIEELQKDSKVRKRSSLITLSPFLDEKGLIRVGGRLQHASIEDTTKHPIIIPPNVHITKLIIGEAHTKTLHGGIQAMMAYVRTRYWVIGLKSAVKKCIRNCKTCIVDKAKVRNQFMGQLPAMRVNEHRPFLNSGVDYAGPVFVRTSKGRGNHATKGYICLFICMATRAIHLEAVSDLTSQAFIAAFRRFVARRGHCMHLWSDNGTNFVGADRELKYLFQASKDSMTQEVAELLANDGTTWHFIPPKMPTYGGLWEAGVQSAKRHLARVNKDTKLTYEELATLLSQIEACLNSRPLCQIDATTETPLTPGHFLVGEALIGVPDQNYEQRKISLLTRWQLIQRLTQDFWRRWRTEYLNTLQQRYKWQVPVPSPVVGDMVVIKDEDTPPTKWVLGRIKQLHPGTDNLVRVVTVQCKGNHELKRPLYKLIPLPKNVE